MDILKAQAEIYGLTVDEYLRQQENGTLKKTKKRLAQRRAAQESIYCMGCKEWGTGREQWRDMWLCRNCVNSLRDYFLKHWDERLNS